MLDGAKLLYQRLSRKQPFDGPSCRHQSTQLGLGVKDCNEPMAHLLEQMFSDDLDKIKFFTRKEIMTSVIYNSLKEKLKKFIQKYHRHRHRHRSKYKEFASGSPQTRPKKTSEKTTDLWKAKIEAFQILKYGKPSFKTRRIFEKNFELSYLGLFAINSMLRRTDSLHNFMDCIT